MRVEGRPWLRRAAVSLFAVLLLLLSIPVLVWLAIPEGKLERWAEHRISRETGVPTDLGPMTKELPPALSTSFLAVLLGDTPVTVAEPLHVKPMWKRLLRGEGFVEFDGRSFGGDLSGLARLSPKRPDVSIRIVGARLADLLVPTGLDAEGIVDMTLESKPAGAYTVRFGAYEVEAGAGLRSRVPFPLTSLAAVEGEAEWKPGGVLEITSASAEGDGIYATLKGSVRKTVLNLDLVQTPSAKWLKEQTVIAPMLERYRLGPGVYSIPIKGTLRNPRIG